MRFELPPGCAGIAELDGGFVVGCDARGLIRFDLSSSEDGLVPTDIPPREGVDFASGLCFFESARVPDGRPTRQGRAARQFFCGWLSGRVALIEVDSSWKRFRTVWEYRGLRSPITLCRRLGPGLALLSARQDDAVVLRFAGRTARRVAKVDGVRGLVAAAYDGPSQWLLVNQIGAAFDFSAENFGVRPCEKFWAWRQPNAVWDVASDLKALCLATDVGLCEVPLGGGLRKSGGGESGDGSGTESKARAWRVDLGPGTGLPLSIAIASDGASRSAWIRDQRGIAIRFDCGEQPAEGDERRVWPRADAGLGESSVKHVGMTVVEGEYRVARVGKDGVLRVSDARAVDLRKRLRRGAASEPPIAAAVTALEEMSFSEPRRLVRLLLDREPTKANRQVAARPEELTESGRSPSAEFVGAESTDEETAREASPLSREMGAIIREALAKSSNPRLDAEVALRTLTYALVGSVSRMSGLDRWRPLRAIGRVVRSVAATVEEAQREYPAGIDLDLTSTVSDCMYALQAFGLDVVQAEHPQDVFVPVEPRARGQGRSISSPAVQEFVREAQLLSYRQRTFKGAGLTSGHSGRAWQTSSIPTPSTWGDHPSSHLVAVAWADGGVDLQGVHYRAASRASEMVPLWSLEEALPSGRKGHKQCRAVALADVDDGLLMLTAPFERRFSSGRRDSTSTLVARWFGAPGAEVSVTKEFREQIKEQAVHSLAWVGTDQRGGQVFAAGLAGSRASSKMLLIRVTSSGIAVLQAAGAFARRDQAPGSGVGNPVLSLAAEPDAQGSGARFVAGCGDGRVWAIQLDLDSIRWPRPGARPHPNLEVEAELVGKVGAPVFAVAASVQRDGRRSVRRVFAGAANGSVIAWQAVHGRGPGSRPVEDVGFATAGPAAGFVRIWATREPSAVSSILPYLWRPERSRADQRAVSVVFRSGRVLLLSDRATVRLPVAKGATGSTTPRNVVMPGVRLDALTLGAGQAYSATVLKRDGTGDPAEHARIVIASANGRVDFRGLYYPRHRGCRVKEYERIKEQWAGLVFAETGSKSALRIGDLMSLVAPEVPRLLIEPVLREDDWGDREPWLPSYLRPLADFARAWRRALRGQVLSGDLRKAVVEPLRQALDRALEIDKRFWFIAILEEVLFFTNAELARVSSEYARGAAGPEVLTRFAAVYREVMNDVQEAANRWRGRDGYSERRVRVALAKRSLDGDAFYSALTALAEADGRAREALESSLRLRVSTLRAWMGTGDPQVVLEAVRAGNISLLRACFRVDQARRSKKGHGVRAIPFSMLEAYLRAVAELAATSLGATDALDAPLEHEIARAFALGVWAAPAHAATAGWILSDHGVSLRLTGRTVRQIRALRLLGLSSASHARTVFQLSLEGRYADLPPEDRFSGKNSELRVHMQAAAKAAGLGKPRGDRERSELVLEGWEQIDRLLEDMLRISTDFEGRAKEVDLAPFRAWKGREERKGDTHYRDSYAFLDERMEALKRELNPFPTAPEGVVQPRVVLVSTSLAAWARESAEQAVARLEDQTLFQPQSDIYADVFARLARAAGGFRSSSAVQSDLVSGVLGHGLLESLTEHAFELREAATALDPDIAVRHRTAGAPSAGEDDERGATVDYFAEYLFQCARDAEYVPKNLRTMQVLVEGNAGTRVPGSLREALKPLEGCVPCEQMRDAEKLEVSAVELTRLQLVAHELRENHRVHYQSRHPKPPIPPRLRVNVERRELTLTFPVVPDEDVRDKLDEDVEQEFQRMVTPSDGVPSHGTGLYLASLSAATAGWSMTGKLNRHKSRLHITLSKRDS